MRLEINNLFSNKALTRADDDLSENLNLPGDNSYSKSLNVIMELRKIANHPLLVRHHYNNDKLRAMAVDILKVLCICLQTRFSPLFSLLLQPCVNPIG